MAKQIYHVDRTEYYYPSQVEEFTGKTAEELVDLAKNQGRIAWIQIEGDHEIKLLGGDLLVFAWERKQREKERALSAQIKMDLPLNNEVTVSEPADDDLGPLLREYFEHVTYMLNRHSEILDWLVSNYLNAGSELVRRLEALNTQDDKQDNSLSV